MRWFDHPINHTTIMHHHTSSHLSIHHSFLNLYLCMLRVTHPILMLLQRAPSSLDGLSMQRCEEENDVDDDACDDRWEKQAAGSLTLASAQRVIAGDTHRGSWIYATRKPTICNRSWCDDTDYHKIKIDWLIILSTPLFVYWISTIMWHISRRSLCVVTDSWPHKSPPLWSTPAQGILVSYHHTSCQSYQKWKD